jgi:hypothetical protein
LKIYPLAQAANPPVTKFTNMSGRPNARTVSPIGHRRL